MPVPLERPVRGLNYEAQKGNDMIVLAMEGSKGKKIHGAYSMRPLEIKGNFHCSGPQPIGCDGGVPEWVANVFDSFPHLNQIALSGENSGVVWTRMENL